ncbi:unnamed protein product [Pylaiella littoralis]
MKLQLESYSTDVDAAVGAWVLLEVEQEEEGVRKSRRVTTPNVRHTELSLISGWATVTFDVSANTAGQGLECGASPSFLFQFLRVGYTAHSTVQGWLVASAVETCAAV